MSGTHKDSAVTAAAGTPVQLAVDQQLKAGDDSFGLTFVEVAEDSRCPSGTTCMWAGQARVVLRSDKGERIELLVPGMSDAVTVKAEIGDVTLTCTGLDPYPEAGRAQEAGAYRVHLSWTR